MERIGPLKVLVPSPPALLIDCVFSMFFPAIIVSSGPWLPLWMAEVTRVLDEKGVAAAILLSLAGVALRAYAPQHQMATEEHVKNGKLTPDEARRQVRFLEISSTVVTLLGVAVLVFVLYDLAQ